MVHRALRSELAAARLDAPQVRHAVPGVVERLEMPDLRLFTAGTFVVEEQEGRYRQQNRTDANISWIFMYIDWTCWSGLASIFKTDKCMGASETRTKERTLDPGSSSASSRSRGKRTPRRAAREQCGSYRFSGAVHVRHLSLGHSEGGSF